LAINDFDLAEQCMTESKDLSGLLLLHSARGSGKGMQKLASLATGESRFNVAFMSLFLTGKLEECLQLLIDCERVSEAAFFARTYLPSKMGEVVELWRADVAKVNEKAAEGLASPEQYGNLFNDLEGALLAEAALKKRRAETLPASQYEAVREMLMVDPLTPEGLAALGGAPAPALAADPLDKAFEAQEAEEEEEEEEEEEAHQADQIISAVAVPAPAPAPVPSPTRPPPTQPPVSAPPTVTAPPVVTAPPRVTAPPNMPPRVSAPPTVSAPPVTAPPRVSAPPPARAPPAPAPAQADEDEDFDMDDDWGME